MLKEAIQKIQELAEAAWKPQLIEVDLCHRHGACLTRDGVDVFENPVAAVQHCVKTLEDLVDICKRWGAASIWHNEQGIVGLLSPDRRDRAVLPLTKTTDFAAVENLRGKIQRMPQKHFVDFLAYTLNLDKAIVAPFRRLDWRGSNGAQGVTEFGGSKMGKQIEATVLGIDTLPETLIIPTRMYRENVGQGMVQIRCLVDIDPMAQTLALVPDERDLDAVIEAVQACIGSRIRDLLGVDSTAVYYGTP